MFAFTLHQPTTGKTICQTAGHFFGFIFQHQLCYFYLITFYYYSLLLLLFFCWNYYCNQLAAFFFFTAKSTSPKMKSIWATRAQIIPNSATAARQQHHNHQQQRCRSIATLREHNILAEAVTERDVVRYLGPITNETTNSRPLCECSRII